MDDKTNANSTKRLICSEEASSSLLGTAFFRNNVCFIKIRSKLSNLLLLCNFLFQNVNQSNVLYKVHIFWEGHKILRNFHLTFDSYDIGQKWGGDFAKFCGLLRIYELYFRRDLAPLSMLRLVLHNNRSSGCFFH